jgi:hypothetical protein
MVGAGGLKLKLQRQARNNRMATGVFMAKISFEDRAEGEEFRV